VRPRSGPRGLGLLGALVAAVVLAGCGTTALSAEEFAWCSNVDHMSREVGDEARSMGLTPPQNDQGITDYALYWATYYYRTNKVKDLRTEAGFVKACAAAYNANPH
jgi:hypothetical protein